MLNDHELPVHQTTLEPTAEVQQDNDAKQNIKWEARMAAN